MLSEKNLETMGKQKEQNRGLARGVMVKFARSAQGLQVWILGADLYTYTCQDLYT